jgi:hypothetical protein
MFKPMSGKAYPAVSGVARYFSPVMRGRTQWRTERIDDLPGR